MLIAHQLKASVGRLGDERMDEQDFIYSLSALGEEFCESLSPVVRFDNIVPQDSYEVFLRAFATTPNPQLLASLSETQLEQLRASCEEYFKCHEITIDHMRSIVSRTLSRWPMDAA
jgi:hypothetical protein